MLKVIEKRRLRKKIERLEKAMYDAGTMRINKVLSKETYSKMEEEFLDKIVSLKMKLEAI